MRVIFGIEKKGTLTKSAIPTSAIPKEHAVKLSKIKGGVVHERELSGSFGDGASQIFQRAAT